MNVDTNKFLWEMYQDDYYPKRILDKGKKALIDLCEKIEATKPKTAEELYTFSHGSTDFFN